MIERHWKAIAKKDRANEYIIHLQNSTFRQIEVIEGFVSARILKREVQDGIEFLIITEWRSVEAIKQFAGSNMDRAVVPELVQDMMIKYDNVVSHYEVNFKQGRLTYS